MMMSPLSEILIKLRHIDPSQIDEQSLKNDKLLIAFIKEKGTISEECLAKAIAIKYGTSFVDAPAMHLSQEAFECMSLDIAKKNHVFPLGVVSNILRVATSKPWDVEFLVQLECLCKHQISFVVATQLDINERLNYAESKIDQLTGLTEDFLLIDAEGDSEKSLSVLDDENAGPIVKFINTTIKTAMNRRASDIHIECYEQSVKVKYRIDGHLYPATEALDVAYHNAFISRLKVMSELDIAEKRVPQDGRFKLSIGQREIDFRISVLPGVHGENIVIRILDSQGVNKEQNGLNLRSLGLTDKQLSDFLRIIHEPYGMVLITGPTGSGKTTTLYSALEETNTGGEKIITIEDPVEYQIDGITQIPVNNKKGLTFAKGLRAILRHDPDKILVGEIRDSETADIAVQSALTGHLVFSSVHANNAIDVMARLNNMGVNLNNALSAMNAVLAQRLIRVLCPECKQPTSAIPQELIDSFEGLDWTDSKIFVPKGCASCGDTGYKGRSVISELLVIDENMRAKVLDGDKVFESFSESGFVNRETLRKVALMRCVEGITSYDEVNRVTFA